MNTILESLKKQNIRFEPDLRSFVLKLISTPSPNLKEELCANLVNETMIHYGFDKVFIDSFGNVIGIIYGIEKNESILLTSHMDTYPFPLAKDEIKRLFEFQLIGDKIFGSHKHDSKYSLAAQIFSGLLLKNSGIKLKSNIIVAATVANENGICLGLRGFLQKTVKELDLNPLFALIGEPTDLELRHSHDGWVLINIQLSGPTTNEVGEAALELINSLENVYSTGSHSAEGKLLSTQNLNMECHRYRTSASIYLLRRLLPNQSVDKVLRDISNNISLFLIPFPKVSLSVNILNNNRTLYNGLTLEVSNQVSAWISDSSNKYYNSILDSLKLAKLEYKPGRLNLSPIGTGSAGSVLVNEFNIPSFEFGPASNNFNGDQREYMDIDKLLQGVIGNAAIACSISKNCND
ncbi:MAG: M20/M25/M40 family metallo-hydrolase [bacterium]